MRFPCTLLALTFLTVAPLHAKKADCRIRDIRGFAQIFANAYRDGTLANLDRRFCAGHLIQVVVEHSISVELNSDPKEKTQCNDFGRLAAWLKARQSDDMPSAGIWPLEVCEKGVCKFGGNKANQAHNTLFLKEIHYQAQKGHFQITKILFEDGD